MFDLLTLGDLVADLVMPIPSLPVRAGEHQVSGGLFLEPGGMGNVLITAQRLGLRTAALGALGDDQYGAQVREALSGEGVDMQSVVEARGKHTSACLTLVDASGAHVFLSVPGNAHEAPLAADWAERVRASRLFYMNGYLLLYPALVEHCFRVLDECRSASVPLFFDPGPLIERLPRPALDRVVRAAYAVLLTADEALALVGTAEPEQAAQRLHAEGVQLVAVKRGARGCYLSCPHGTAWSPAFAVTVKDLAGAGDAFDAALMREHLRGAPPAQLARFANAAGAAAVARMGTGRRMPHLHELERLLSAASADPALAAA